MKIRTIDGETFVGNDAKAVVRQMRDAAWRWKERKGLYMNEVVYTVEGLTNLEYRTSLRGRLNAHRFLRYLADVRMIEILS